MEELHNALTHCFERGYDLREICVTAHLATWLVVRDEQLRMGMEGWPNEIQTDYGPIRPYIDDVPMGSFRTLTTMAGWRAVSPG